MLGIILLNIIKIAFLLGFLIFIHECGHFFIAKLFKVKVLEFAIGFGPTILSKQGKETKYELRLIPLGGFVNMLGEEKRTDEEGAYNKASIPKRMGILVAGGLVNVIFGLLVFFILVATASSSYISTKIESLKENYAAEAAGIQIGDKVLKINDKRIRLKSDIDDYMENYNGEELNVKIKRNDEIINILLYPTEEQNKTIGVYFGTVGDASTKIQSIYASGPAEEAGLKAGDVIKTVDGIYVDNDVNKAIEAIQKSEEDEIVLTIDRDNAEKTINVKPQVVKQYYLGVVFETSEKNFGNRMYYAFWQTVDFSVSIIDNLKEMFAGKVKADQLMGPIGISEVVTKTRSFDQFIYILALISLSLGVTNLLPFPPLDGGKVVLLIIEAIRRKPMSENAEYTIQMIGFFLLIGLSIFVTYNDILRIIF